MHIAVRSSVATGVALVGAGALALSPLQPVASPLSNVGVPAAFSTAGVELTASFDPVTPWVEVFTAAASNVTAIGEDWLANPLPGLRQLATNWFGYADTTATALGGVAQGTWTYLTQTVPESVNTALQQIADGDLSGAASTINNALGSAIFAIGLPLFPVLDIPGKITDNLTAVVKAVTSINAALPLVVGLLGPIEGGIQAFGDNAQTVLNAASAGDYATAFNAAVNTLPAVVGAVLNGYQDGVYPGLLSVPTDPSGFGGGLAYALLVTLPQTIATALGATPPVTTTALKQATPSAEAVVADEPAAGEAGSGVGHSKSSTGSAGSSADESTATSAAATDDTPDSATAVKDGNKFEPGQVSGSGAGARTASSAKSPAATSAGASDHAGGAGGKGHSARHAAGKGD
ncbi:hypothetical protein H7J51_19680 [Mycobacterium crocinum]|uniref:PE-PGRS family protein n=1 Tax=Mycolicibacterium crocinum TaxID=388459 RepID=A0ABY3TLQ0_9MYCO|nr:hypothetical protein [Mycolicibacterium crocinum]MCV7217501.1 hypothetical protein [Mycolicibacterium crocinum]ULN42382.1 hypothetical protein MI149_04465 [Mycolicibacterium crocinum]